ncbi:MAG TPA: FkbM family methyltransferase [Burkholderiales bacterium]|nr:FkbM family methyltransferase [Burkholderiales bacterium]
MSRLDRMTGVARSLAVYYGIPFRTRRLARLYAPFVAPGGLAFDVGAHAGSRVRAFRRLGARVVAVEPQPDFVRLLEALYGRDPEVAIAAAAVGRASGEATLHASERTPTVTTLSPAWAARVGADASFRGVRWLPGARVPVTTLDALIAAHGRPDFVKLDVEGYESEALAGLSAPVVALSFEYLAAARDVALDCVDRLCALGNYEYNWSRGERQRLAERAWLEAGAIRAFLRALPAGAGSGDVYARLRT